MSNIKKIISASTLFALVIVAGFVIVGRGSVYAQELVQENNQQTNNNQSQSFNYVAQPGDSFSLMARKAIQTYGINNKVNLSEAQIIFAETNITQTAGSPVLAQGQKVEINETTVKDWVEKAKSLTAEQQAAWDVYAKQANFNTNKVGQAS